MAEASVKQLQPHAEPGAIHRRVEAELTRLLYRLAGFGLFSNFALAVLLFAGLLPYFPVNWCKGWLAGIIAVSFARWLLNHAFAREARADAEMTAWRRKFLAGVAVAGAMWGVAGWAFLSTNALFPRLLLLLLPGRAPCPATTQSAWHPPTNHRVVCVCDARPPRPRRAPADAAGQARQGWWRWPYKTRWPQ